MNLLWRSSLRYLLSHRWLLALSIIGVTLGVAVVVSIDIANVSARKAFELSSETVAGRATHRIAGPSRGIADSVYTHFRTRRDFQRSLFQRSAPVVEGYALVPDAPGRTLHVLGVDALAEAPFRSFVGQGDGDGSGVGGGDGSGVGGGDGSVVGGGVAPSLVDLMYGGNTGILAAPTATALDLAIGDTLRIAVDGVPFAIRLVGLIAADDDRRAAAIDNLLVTDVSVAQRLFDMVGRLSHIDLILNDDETQALEAVLPVGASIETASSRSETLAQMTRAFELNLTALSLLALVVGMFLTYNTMNFSVVQRRPLIGRFRAVGVTRREIFVLVLAEALLVGIVGTALGILCGVFLGRGLVHLVTRTINDLYFVVSVRQLTLAPATLAKGVLLGLGATVAAAWMPARSATRTSASTVLARSREEVRAQRQSVPVAFIGLVAGAGGSALLMLPTTSIALSYIALFFVIVAFALLVPVAVVAFVRVVRGPMASALGPVGRMAANGISAMLSRTSVAIAALMIAVAATIGVGIMVESFRTTVTSWLNNALEADIYIQPPNVVFRSGAAEIQPEIVQAIRSVDGVAESYSVRHVQVNTSVGMSQLTAVEPRRDRESSYVLQSGDPAEVFVRFEQPGQVMLSEPYAYRHGLSRGDTLTINTDRGPRVFNVAAVFYDYASDQGLVLMHRENYERYFDDRGYSGLALYAASDAGTQNVIDRVRGVVGERQELLIRSNRDLREYSLEVFDRTFTITMVLRLLAVVVAFVGIVGAMLALQIERVWEFRVLRSIGMTRRQRSRMIHAQTGLMGLLAGLLSIPLGLLLAWVLIFVINKRSFGWTLQFESDFVILAQALGVSVGAALLAGWVAGFVAGRSQKDARA